MPRGIGDALHRGRVFLTRDLWNAEFESRRWPARGLRVLQLGAMIGEGFVRDQLLLRASALTYFTVLSLVPLVAIAIAIADALGFTADFAEVVVKQIAAGSPESQQRILDLIGQANLAGIGGVGGAVLFVMTLLGISNIERSLNHIWGVTQTRSLGRRFTDYLAVLVVAPLLMATALSLGATLKSQWLVQRLIELPLFATFYDLGLQQLPAMFLTLAFAFLYWFLPNTVVRPAAALLGGVVAAVLVNVAQSAYLGFSIGATRASAFFGGFAQLPLLLVWIYCYWAVLLLGAEVAFAYQNLPLYRREVRGRVPGPSEREAIAFRIALEVARAFRDRAEPWSSDELADALGVPVRSVRDLLAALDQAGIVSRVGEASKEDAYQLGRPAEGIQLVDVLVALRGAREAASGDRPIVQSVEQLLDELREAERKGAAGRTLADLLETLPARAIRA